MQPHALEPDAGAQTRERMGELPRIDGPTVAAIDDDPRIHPRLPQQQAPLRLILPPPPQRLDGERWQRDRAPRTVGLRRHEDQLAAHALQARRHPELVSLVADHFKPQTSPRRIPVEAASTSATWSQPSEASSSRRTSAASGTTREGRPGRGGLTAAAGFVASTCHRTPCRSADDSTA